MDREEKCELVSDAQYAYGELGRFVPLNHHCGVSYFYDLPTCHLFVIFIHIFCVIC